MGGGLKTFRWEDLCESCKGYPGVDECFCPAPTSPERPSAKADPVNHPPHYMAGGIETIDAIEAALTAEEFRGYCKGNALKYVWREKHKGQNESLRKAIWYLNRLVNK